jgi:hypothetical protein
MRRLTYGSSSGLSSLGENNLKIFARNDHPLVAGYIEASD